MEIDSMYAEEEEREKRNAAKMGDYENPENGCPNCGRHRVMRGDDGKRRGERACDPARCRSGARHDRHRGTDVVFSDSTDRGREVHHDVELVGERMRDDRARSVRDDQALCRAHLFHEVRELWRAT